MNIRKNLWVYKYSPKTFDDIILNDKIKSKLSKAVKEIPNMLLYGTPGIGKGCIANIIKNKDNIDYMWINGSDENGIDVFRDKIKPFATAMCMKEMKVVIINEADALTSGISGSQKLLRQLIEDCYNLARFIFICNYDNNIIPEIKSRCQIFRFDNPPKKEIGKLCLNILKKENIKYNSKDVIEIIKKTYPDIRKCILALQENTIDGKLVGSHIYSNELVFEKLLDLILKKDVENVREELVSNYINYDDIYEYLYNKAGEFKQPGAAILLIGKYLYQNATIVNKEINFMTMICEMIYKKIVSL